MIDFSDGSVRGRFRQIVLSISAFLACIITVSPVAEVNVFCFAQTLMFDSSTYTPMVGTILFHHLSRRLHITVVKPKRTTDKVAVEVKNMQDALKGKGIRRQTAGLGKFGTVTKPEK